MQEKRVANSHASNILLCIVIYYECDICDVARMYYVMSNETATFLARSLLVTVMILL